MNRVLIVGGKELFRIGLRCLLAEHYEHALKLLDVVYQEAIPTCEKFGPSVVLLDTDARDGYGLDLVSKLVDSPCAPKVVIITCEREPALLNLQLETGATGFLTKDCSTNDCIDAVNAAINSTNYVSPQFSRLIVLGKIGRTDKNSLNLLSRREMSTMLMLAEGMTNKEIAKSLNISPKTVTSYKLRIHEKLKTRNVADIARVAVRAGLLGPS